MSNIGGEGIDKTKAMRKLFLHSRKLDENRVMNVLVVELRQHERLVTLPDFFIVVREDLAVKSLRHALLDEEIHRFAALGSHHKCLSAFAQKVIYRVNERAP